MTGPPESGRHLYAQRGLGWQRLKGHDVARPAARTARTMTVSGGQVVGSLGSTAIMPGWVVRWTNDAIVAACRSMAMGLDGLDVPPVASVCAHAADAGARTATESPH